MWLDDLLLSLDQAVKPVSFFFRNDDAGWADSQLFELLDCFSSVEIPIDLAVIPLAIEDHNRSLYERVKYSKGLIRIHQHGYSHNNHQLQGRKCEFGSDRTGSQQQADIQAGQDLLLEYFEGQVDPIFTPPWNRCNQDTINALINLGFTTLSRDNTADHLHCHRLNELPINIDWFKKRNGTRLNRFELVQLIVQVINGGESVGVMLHHEIMDHQEREVLSELLELLSSHPRVKCEHMNEILNLFTAKCSVVN